MTQRFLRAVRDSLLVAALLGLAAVGGFLAAGRADGHQVFTEVCRSVLIIEAEKPPHRILNCRIRGRIAHDHEAPEPESP